MDQGSCQTSSSILKNFLSQTPNLFWFLEFALVRTLYYLEIMWYPYYFSKMGYLNMGAFISMVPPVGVLVGSIVIGWIVKKFDLPEHWTVSICLFFMVMVQLALCFLELLEENT